MQPSDPEEKTGAERAQDYEGYAGRWIARQGERVVAQGGTPDQALQAAASSRFKESLEVAYIPTARSLVFSGLFDRVRQALPTNRPIYLVGGAVRDAVLGIASHDLDFVFLGDPRPVGRRLADDLDGAYYLMDAERKTVRVIITEDDQPIFLDFAVLQGKTLEEDLAKRDFTLNAMAVAVSNPQQLLDPLAGAADLYKKVLKACSPSAFQDDPIRVLRGVRLAAAYQFKLDPSTRGWMRQAGGGLAGVSAERLRDELFKILEGPQVTSALRALDWMGVYPNLLPEVPRLKGVTQSAPHQYDVWEHTLKTIDGLDALLDVLSVPYNPEKASNLNLSLVVLKLGRFREQLADHLATRLNPNRSLRGLLTLALLYHDIAKPDVRRVEEDGRIRFFDHEVLGAKVIEERGRQLELSNSEIERLSQIVRNHMRIPPLAQKDEVPTRRAIYRFFRDTDEAGVDVCLVKLADVLGVYGPTLPPDTWTAYLETCRLLLEAWWEKPKESISPPPWLNGNDLQAHFGLSPGPQIGKILEALREAQADGQISDRDSALIFVKEWLEGNLPTSEEDSNDLND